MRWDNSQGLSACGQLGDYLVDGLFACKEPDISIIINMTILNYMTILIGL